MSNNYHDYHLWVHMSTINVQSDDDHALKCMKKFQDFSFLTPSLALIC